MSMLIQHNIAAMNAERQFNIVTKAKNKRAEKLSSGYRINRAADDAAGLSISEKMRRQIRGLKVGTENAQMGISWVQIGEGALNEAHDILHRMNQLSIKSQNGTNTLTDRAYMQMEFEQLQNELDRISTTTTFNELNIFEEHEPVYDQISGNIEWDYEEYHEIRRGKNDLTITYRTEATDEAQVMTISVAAGRYTTHELIDAIDDAFGVDSPIHMEFTDKGVCKLNLEGGEVIDSVTGALTYLMWDNYDGGGYGTLIGTTSFYDDTTPILEVYQGKNDKMEFWIEYFDDDPANPHPAEKVTIDLIEDSKPANTMIKFSKNDLMALIDAQIQAQAPNSGLKTSHYGDAIQLSSPDGIVTGFKGNMFKLEVKPETEYDSVFYDNIKEGYVWQDPAFVAGGAVLTTDTRDKEHNRYYIDGTNDTLVLYPNPKTSAQTGPTTIKITHNTTDGYTAKEMVKELNDQFKAAGIDGEVQAHLVRSVQRDSFPNGKAPVGSGTAVKESVGDDSVYFEGVEIRTVREGPDAIVGLQKVKDANNKDTDQVDKTVNTAYDTLFTIKDFNVYGTGAADATVNNQTIKDKNAEAYSAETFSDTEKITIKNGVNDRFKLTLRSNGKNGSSDFTPYTKVIDILGSSTKAMTASEIAAAIQKEIDKDNNLKNRIEAVFEGGRIRIRDKEDLTLDDVNDAYLNWYPSIELQNAGNNAGYRDIFQQKYYYYVNRTVSKNNALSLTVPSDKSKIGNSIKVTIDGESTTFDITGAKTAADIATKMNQTTPIRFQDRTGYGYNTTRPVSMNGTGTTKTVTNSWAAGKAVGTSEKVQGRPGVYANEPATLAIGPAGGYLPSGTNKITIKRGVNDTIALNINGQGRQVLTLTADAAGTQYTADELAAELQKQIENTFGDDTGWGRATVDVKDGQFVLTCTIPKGKKGEDTSIESYNDISSNTFFANPKVQKTAAKAVSDQALYTGSYTLTDGVDDEFVFYYDDGTGSREVTLDLVDSAAGASPKTESFNASSILTRIQTKLAAAVGDAVEATTSNGRLVLTTKATGSGTSITYNMAGTDANAQKIFGLNKTTRASITLSDKKIKSSATFATTNTEKTFSFTLNGSTKTVKIKGGWTSYADLQNKLNDGLTADKKNGLTAMGMKATITNGILTLEKTTDPASNSTDTLTMTYVNGGDSVMGDMFGYEPKPNVEVSGSGNTLTIKASGKKISVDSDTGGGLVEPTKLIGYADDYEYSGYHSADYSTLTSTTLAADGYELNRWNNDFKFHFTEDGGKTYNEISVTLPESAAGKKTSLNDIKTQLQSALDTAMGGHKIEVLLDNMKRQLSLKSVKPGSQFQFLIGTKTVDGKVLKGLQSNSYDDGDVGGGFFHHVMCSKTLSPHKLSDPTDINGDQFADNIFAMGRHDVVFDRASLHPGISDTLILDLNFYEDADHDGILDADKNKDGKLDEQEKKDVKIISLTLKPETKIEDWLTSSDQEVLATFREQIDVAIENWNASDEAKNMGIQLNKGLIEVDIGKHDTGVWGNKDKVALSFTITQDKEIAMPVEGYFYIDGIRGNAAYETFYYTEGDLIPAYIVGTKDISKGVILDKDDNELVFLVDDEMKTIKLDKLEKGKKYSAEEIIEAITKEFENQGLPLAVSMTQRGALKISYNKMGLHRIEQVTGSAREKLFFQEGSAKRMSKERDIRISSFEGDRLSVYSPRFSTTMLGVNSICISTIKNAEKATNRLKEAIKKVSDMRSTFGAIQNRFEHTVNNNLNKHENLQAAESRIRDADISNEMMDFSNLSIIQQAGQAILAQANQSRQGMLSLLG